MRDNPIRKFRCLHCHKKMDMACDPDGDSQPKPGNLCICSECGHVMIFDDAMWPRNPTKKEIVELAGNPEMLKVQKILGEMRKRFYANDIHGGVRADDGSLLERLRKEHPEREPK